MIFVSTGTIGFEELVKKIDQLIEKAVIKEKTIIQIGNSKYIPKNCEYFRFKPSLAHFYQNADLIVAHGGAAITFEIISKGIKLISVNNPFRTDKHQEDLLRILSKKKNLLWCKDLEKLGEFINKAKTFKFNKYRKSNCNIHKELTEYLKTII